jgi:hypothetical protein
MCVCMHVCMYVSMYVHNGRAHTPIVIQLSGLRTNKFPTGCQAGAYFTRFRNVSATSAHTARVPLFHKTRHTCAIGVRGKRA